MEQIAHYIEVAADWFAYPLICVIMGTAIFFTIRLRFVQIFRFREAIRETIASRQSGASGALSPLQAFMTALAATIGTGNIAGVATAIVSGGPGAVLDLVLRYFGDVYKVRRGLARHAFSCCARRNGAGWPHVLSPRRTQVADAGRHICFRRGRWGPSYDAAVAAQLRSRCPQE